MISTKSFVQQIPQNVAIAFDQRLGARGLSPPVQVDYRKWLRYYLDFCARYRHPPADRDSLPEFLRKLSSKGQSLERQQTAVASVQIYHELLKGGLVAGGDTGWEACLERLREEVRLRQYSPKTLQTYRTWANTFRGFLDGKEPGQVDSEDVRGFLTDLAVRKKVAASTQNQAFNALLFLFRHVLEREYDLKDKVVRARRSRYVPVVLSRAEVDAITGRMHGAKALAVKLLYGCGLRLAECLNLRVQHFNFDAGILTVRQGKGRKDRAVPLPETLLADLKRQLAGLRRLHEEDLAADYYGAFMPEALDRKGKHAAKELIWQWFFPARNLTFVPEEGGHRRYHMHETSLSTALRVAVRKSGVAKRVTCHTFRHSFASHLLRANYDIRTIQEMLGHSSVTTTMIYTHTVKSRTLKERRSPLDLRAELVDDLAIEG